jgi:DNA-directed RNA polymerase subunit M/transcription elongation factor TFIIS
VEIRCPNCQEFFEANSHQKSLVDKAIKKNMGLLFVECPKCYKDVPIDPQNLLSKEPQKDENQKNKSAEMIECPICHEGAVSYIDDGDERFWGCGECGNVWFTKSELEKAIKNSR